MLNLVSTSLRHGKKVQLSWTVIRGYTMKRVIVSRKLTNDDSIFGDVLHGRVNQSVDGYYYVGM